MFDLRLKLLKMIYYVRESILDNHGMFSQDHGMSVDLILDIFSDFDFIFISTVQMIDLMFVISILRVFIYD